MIRSEHWHDVPDGSGYQVSTFGRVRSVDRIGPGRCGKPRRLAGRILRPSPNTHGYLCVALGKSRFTTVHSLVALAFHGPRPDGMTVNHKDGDKRNNRPGNLEYVTHQANNLHALNTGLRSVQIGPDEIARIVALKGKLSLREIGRRFGISHTYVRYILNGRRVAAC